MQRMKSSCCHYVLDEEMNSTSDVQDQSACQGASRYLLRIFMEANSYVQSPLLEDDF